MYAIYPLRGYYSYTIHYYDSEGNLHTDQVRTEETAIALARQSLSEAWVTDADGTIVYCKPSESEERKGGDES